MERAARSIVRVIGVVLLILGFYASADAGLAWALGIVGFLLIMLS